MAKAKSDENWEWKARTDKKWEWKAITAYINLERKTKQIQKYSRKQEQTKIESGN